MGIKSKLLHMKKTIAIETSQTLEVESPTYFSLHGTSFYFNPEGGKAIRVFDITHLQMANLENWNCEIEEVSQHMLNWALSKQLDPVNEFQVITEAEVLERFYFILQTIESRMRDSITQNPLNQ